MSIPPLVCSTPPPPDQCDDDRDAEDFDIQYNLSQDDEDEGHDYSYGTYSDYIYSTSTSSTIHQDIWSSNISKKTDDKLCSDLLEEKKDTMGILPKDDNSSLNKIGFEDIVIEDLNLKLENQNDEVSIEQSTNKIDAEHISGVFNKDLSKQLNAVDEDGDDKSCPISQDFNVTPLLNDDVKTCTKNMESEIDETIEEEYTQESCSVDIMESNKNIQIMGMSSKIDEICHNFTEPTESNLPVIEKDSFASELKPGDLTDDDFGDFDDFQCTPSENNPIATITHCDNPWNSEVSKNSEFGDFTATFDVDDIDLCTRSNNDEENKINENHMNIKDDGIDDFEDFDDFKSSSNEYIEKTLVKNEPSQNVPVLCLHSPDNENQIIESINSVLSSIFTSEISEFDNSFEGRLESLLNETWGHLVDTDVRQSYIVNWNNSLGQKSLLKALCIDSRNILFGPKWNNSMPKYAANLTVAPLQPQKPVTPTSNRNVDEQNKDKATNKESGTWTDPFTSDGQEYTYAEALLLDLEHLMATLDQMAHKHSSFKISELLTNACNSGSESSATIARPANLDVFTNVISPEVDHIYSSTLSVQPIRQINLPDTHIFTPTDSETPRSKTIHYDQSPSALVTEPSEGSRQLDELNSKSKKEVSVNNSENDEDYWEFQDFKGSSSSTTQVMNKPRAENNDNSHQLIKTYETQILQPIKVEPIMPALNWPDPGEVKETFDDFSEFVSNTSWNNENAGNQTDSRLNNKPVTETLEDDFETFQSAPTLKCTITPIDGVYQTGANINHHSFSDFPQNLTDPSDNSHSKIEGIIMSKETLVQNELYLSSTDNFSTVKDSNEKISNVLSSGSQRNSATMQPSISNTSASQRTQQKTGQILQPLSLESYSQINWPSPGIDLQDLSRFNPVESLQSLKSDSSTGGSSKLGSPAHKEITARNEVTDEDIWGEFVSSKPKQHMPSKKVAAFADDDEWTDFVSSPSVKPQNGLNTISLNVHTNLNMQKHSGPNKFHTKNNQLTLDIPTLKYVTPKSSNRGLYNEKHFQNL